MSHETPVEQRLREVSEEMRRVAVRVEEPGPPLKDLAQCADDIDLAREALALIRGFAAIEITAIGYGKVVGIGEEEHKLFAAARSLVTRSSEEIPA